MLRRLVTTAVLAVASGLVWTGSAIADPVAPATCDEKPVPGCVVEAQTPGRDRETSNNTQADCHDRNGAVVACFKEGRGSIGSDGCYYDRIDGGPPPPGAQGPGAWYQRSCSADDLNGPLGVPLVGSQVWLPDGAVTVSPEVLAQEAVSRLDIPLPVIRLSPAPPAPQIVFLPTWVWLDEGSWGSRSATASVPGLSVTATATPRRLVISPGDGATVTCTGRGVAWTSGTDPEKASDCGHTYTSLPSGGAYTLRATVTWTVSWTGGGAAGTVPDLTTTAAVDVEVREAGALNAGGLRP
ncbi:hypothetical protein GCM10009557_00280 [Virgisporangium ochraceum]|uniref:ATP/GTP-binding protein n=1 Tax=Virgisporangium ochraceum TaxID=65505 RepID=A0A8J4A652_9ACTN|nr:hypothetical protein [Virgisporangium ochraceum]GIJ74060.1 hypothetical protein Voc01_089770 [Virgisporangium ochraceum]